MTNPLYKCPMCGWIGFESEMEDTSGYVFDPDIEDEVPEGDRVACPECQTRMGWMSDSDEPSEDYLVVVTEPLYRCPECGWVGAIAETEHTYEELWDSIKNGVLGEPMEEEGCFLACPKCGHCMGEYETSSEPNEAYRIAP